MGDRRADPGPKIWDRILCRLGRCRNVVIFTDSVGIGGRCVHCSQLHGWMTHEELRAILDGRRGSYFATPLEKYEVATPPRAFVVRGPKGWQ